MLYTIRKLSAMSITLTLMCRSSYLHVVHFPPFDLEGCCSLGLDHFQTYNAIPKIDEDNCKLYLVESGIVSHEVSHQVGSYEIYDIARYIEDCLSPLPNIELELHWNPNTLKSDIRFNEDIDFTKPDTTEPMLGCTSMKLVKHMCHRSFQYDTNNINGRPINMLHEFSPMVLPGYKLVMAPQSIIYVSVFVKRAQKVFVTVIDQREELVNILNKEITLHLHLRRWV
ncbi:hypothetical protein PR048_007253 [Dryococelus australis]|uniref:Uncharacterized protein n=1 Tax=Dryococelus australis TaxID=614101 RepID=A0ABQ9ID42_9NEOP|nr:hypothetical protein PR048_007253 [Dryococelus australis]